MRHGAAMGEAARRFGVPVELLLAIALAESGGNAVAVREEPGFTSDAATPSFRGLLQRPEEAASAMSERAIHTRAASGRGDRTPA